MEETRMATRSRKISLFEVPALAELVAATPVVDRAAGEAIFASGEPCRHLPILVSGNIRIFASGHNGRQVTLYRLKPGEVCPISLSSLLQCCPYPATAVAETRVAVRFLPADEFESTIRRTPEIFSVFLQTFAACLYDSVCTAQQLMFDSLDVRLANLLDEQFDGSPDQTINFTHEEIAHELGTTRVVASRLLKKLERANCIRLCRRKIALNDAAALKNLTHASLFLPGNA